MNKLLLPFLLLPALAAGQGIESVQKVGEYPIKDLEGLVYYALPRTILQIHVATSKTTTQSGPYALYADEFLGIKNVAVENSVDWQIDSIRLETASEADPDEMYAVKIKKGFSPKTFFNFSDNGLIISPNTYTLCTDKTTALQASKKVNAINEASMRTFYSEKADTFYKTILKDSIFIKVPVIKPRTELKTIKDKAREAADVIIKIRQRRFEMIMAEDEALPDERALKLALSEMQKTEDEYLTLFTGRKLSEHFSNAYLFTPEYSNSDAQTEIFRFSSKAGIADKTVTTATPVVVSFEKENRTRELKQLYQTALKPRKPHLIYRIPEVARVYVLWKGEALLSQKIEIDQFGTCVSYPVFQ